MGIPSGKLTGSELENHHEFRSLIIEPIFYSYVYLLAGTGYYN